MTIKGGTSPACAACKYQRRRCSKECPLAPFFPADQPEKFQCAHRLFGVRNIMSILKQVNPERKQDAMTSIIFESAMRARFPVHGCLGIIRQLQSQLEQTLEELRLVRTRLAVCKEECQQQQHIPFSQSSHNINYGSSNELGFLKDDVISIQQHTPSQYNNMATMPVFTNYEFLTNGISNIDQENFGKPMKIQNLSSNNSVAAVQPTLYASQDQYPIQQELDVSYYDDIPFDTIVDDRQSFIESKEACESRYVDIFQGIL